MTASLKTSLQDQLDRITQNTRALVQPERLAISEKATADLFNTGIEDRILKPGAQAPSFTLEDARTGKPVHSADLLALGPLVVSFFRGRWDPYCVTELEAWRDLYPQVRERGALFVAISPQTTRQNHFTLQQHASPTLYSPTPAPPSPKNSASPTPSRPNTAATSSPSSSTSPSTTPASATTTPPKPVGASRSPASSSSTAPTPSSSPKPTPTSASVPNPPTSSQPSTQLN